MATRPFLPNGTLPEDASGVVRRQFPAPIPESGQGYTYALRSRQQAILNTLLSLRSNLYRDSTASTEYSKYLSSMAQELATLTLNLEAMSNDISFNEVRSEYLYQKLGYLIFLNQQIPDTLQLNDEGFRRFLLTVLDIFFQGSTPEAILQGVQLFTNLPVELRENYLDARRPGSIYDISDQFGFRIEVVLSGNIPPDFFNLTGNVRLLLDLIRPAHTLYTLGLRLSDGANGDDEFLPFTDTLRWNLYNYHYEDLRRDCSGRGPITGQGAEAISQNQVLMPFPVNTIQEECSFTVLSGPNTGVYIIKAVDIITNSITVHPFLSVFPLVTPMDFFVEFDRRGRSPTLSISGEEHTGDYVQSTLPLTVTTNSPQSGIVGAIVNLSAVPTSDPLATIQWDLDGDGIYEFTGQIAPYTISGPLGAKSVYGICTRGNRSKKFSMLVETIP